MCGIVGYTGKNDCVDLLIDGLSKLEYRGYDSAGIAVMCDGQIEVKSLKEDLQTLKKRWERKENLMEHVVSDIQDGLHMENRRI